MDPFQILKLIALINIILPTIGCAYLIKRLKGNIENASMVGGVFLVIFFIFTYLGSFIGGETYNFLTNLFIMMTGIFYFFGIIYAYYINYIKKALKQQIEINEKDIK